jgi:hypothetical protein
MRAPGTPGRAAIGAPSDAILRTGAEDDALALFAEFLESIRGRRWAAALRCQARLDRLGFIVAAKRPGGRERTP